jgi:hypothetical protein
MSKTGVSLSPGPDNGEAANEGAPTVDPEVARVPALTGSSCDTCGNPKKKSAPPDAASATRHGTTILTVDAVLNMTRQLREFAIILRRTVRTSSTFSAPAAPSTRLFL